MKTLVATVSIGPRDHLTRHTLPRLERRCRAHGLEFVLVRAPRPALYSRLMG